MKILTLTLAALGLLVSCSKKESGEEAEAPAPVQVTPVVQETIHRTVATDGVLYPLEQRDLMPKISAPVEAFHADRGDHVHQGQLLAVLQNRDLKGAATAAQGQLAQAQANLGTTAGATVPEEVTKAKTDVDAARQQEQAAQKLLTSRRQLFEEGALARKLVDEAQVSYTNAQAQLATAQEHLRALQSVGKQEQIQGAKAQVQTAEGQLQNAQAQVNYSEIRSPINGVIADRPLHAGDVASTGQPLFVIMNIARVVARVNVPVNQASIVQPGDPAVIRTADGSVALPGKVTVVSPATDPAATTVQVWVEASNPGERVKPGTSVHVVIDVATIPNATVVPSAAIVPGENGGDAVMTVASGTAHLQPVQTGARQGDRVQILRGVSAGQQVITVGAIGLEDNAKVRVVQPASQGETDADRSGSQP